MFRAEVCELMLKGLDGVAGRGGALSPSVPIERDGLDVMRLASRTGDDCAAGRLDALVSLEGVDCVLVATPLCSGLWIMLLAEGCTG